MIVRPPPPPNSETILAFPEHIEPLRHVRSTLLIASLENLRANGHYDEYLQRLPAEHRQTIVESVVGVWLPLEVAEVHYDTCARLGISLEEQLAMGKRSVDRIGMSMVGTALRMAKQAGATPWSFFPHMQRFWARGYDGGGIAVWKVGPKDARIDLVGFALCTNAFYRHVLRGWVGAVTGMFCRQLYLREERQPVGLHSLSFRVQWA